MNGFAHQYFHAEKLKKSGKNFRSIFGIEAYFLPSISKWKILHEEYLKASRLEKEEKKSKTKTKSVVETPEVLSDDVEVEGETVKTENSEEDDIGGTVIEDEEESKSNKIRNPVFQRNHLVLLAKNSQGLKDLFKIVSASAADGFYNVPRVDLELLEKYAKGNIIASTACIAGPMAKIIFDNQIITKFDELTPNRDNFELIQAKLLQLISDFQSVLGKENFNLELQFNKLESQHLVNLHLIEASRRSGAPLIVTCDAHYSDPSHWREREIYKLMNPKFLKNQEENAKKLPERIDQLKCELYPKNAEQVWKSFEEYCSGYDFYDKELMSSAIERTHDIAWNQIEEVKVDKRVKLPNISKLVSDERIKELKEKTKLENEDDIAFQELKAIAIEGLKFRKVEKKQLYVDRLKYELGVIKQLNFSKYFLTYHKIMKILGEKMLLGNARGCFLPESQVKLTSGESLPIKEIELGEKVLDAYGNAQVVEDKFTYECKDEELLELEFNDGKIIKCTRDHKFLTENRGWIKAEDLTDEDEIKEV